MHLLRGEHLVVSLELGTYFGIAARLIECGRRRAAGNQGVRRLDDLLERCVFQFRESPAEQIDQRPCVFEDRGFGGYDQS